MPNPYFQFKRFTVRQDRCAMKVGTDGVLLGAWCGVEEASSILDIGAGTGLVALMAAQRSQAEIVAVELDESAACQAAENVKESPWQDRIKVVCSPIQSYAEQAGRGFDRIVSNPPYFQDSLKSPKEERSWARHTDSLSYGELVKAVAALLNPGGTFSVIVPTTEFADMERQASTVGLHCVRRTDVLPTPTTLSKRVLAEFSMAEDLDTKCDELIIEAAGRHQYSADYIALTRDFYLKM